MCVVCRVKFGAAGVIDVLEASSKESVSFSMNAASCIDFVKINFGCLNCRCAKGCKWS